MGKTNNNSETSKIGSNYTAACHAGGREFESRPDRSKRK